MTEPLSPYAQQVYDELRRIAGPDGSSKPTQKRFVTLMNCDVSFIRKAQKELAARGLIRIERHSGRPTVFRLTKTEGQS